MSFGVPFKTLTRHRLLLHLEGLGVEMETHGTAQTGMALGNMDVVCWKAAANPKAAVNTVMGSDAQNPHHLKYQ